MDRDELFRLAVQLAAPYLGSRALLSEAETAIATQKILSAYKAILDAHNNLPEIHTQAIAAR